MTYTVQQVMEMFGKSEKYWQHYTKVGKLPKPALENEMYSDEQLPQIETAIGLITQHTNDNYLLSTGKVLSEVQARQAQLVANYEENKKLDVKRQRFWDNENRIKELKEQEKREIAERRKKRGSSVSDSSLAA